MIVDLLTYYRFAFLLFFPKAVVCEPVCTPPYSCISTRECAERHANGGTEEVLFQCARKTKVCCPPVENAVTNPTLPEIRETTEHQPEINRKVNESKPAIKHFDEYNHLKKFDFTKHRNAYLLGENSTCGNTPYDNKVSQGEEANLGEFPWMTLIGYKGKRDPNKSTFFCGGTLINDFYVLTAAHCVTIRGSDPEFVRLGEHNIASEKDCFDNQGINNNNPPVCFKYKDVDVEKVIAHEGWNEGSIKNDIALLKLSEKATDESSFNIASICLPLVPSMFNFTDDSKYEVAGWGKTDSKDNHGSEKLMKAQKNLFGISLDECNYNICNNPSNRSFCPITDSQICIKGSFRVDVCKGDSGGPLMLRHRTKIFQLGIVSFKSIDGCGEPGIPSVLTNVIPYIPWILDNMEEP